MATLTTYYALCMCILYVRIMSSNYGFEDLGVVRMGDHMMTFESGINIIAPRCIQVVTA